MEKLKISLPVLVEGKYDKITLSSVIDAKIISLSGFGIFNSKEKQLLIRRLADSGGLILLTDSDSGGIQIRSFVSGIVPKDRLFHVYIPKIKGKEKRKATPSKQGLLGVEGMDREVLEKLLLPFASGNACEKKSEKQVSKTDFFLDGLSGGACASVRRDLFAKLAELPSGMSANALLDAVNMLCTYEEYKGIISKM